MLGFQMAFDVTGDPEFPEQEAFKVARELGVPVTTHAGVWGATNDDGIRLMHEHDFMAPGHIYVHAATLNEDSYHRIAATGGSVSVSTESEQSAGQGYPPTWQLRKHDIPVSLSMDTSVWWSGDLFCAMRSTLGADRSREHLEAHAKQETVTNHHLRAEQVVDWATRGGSKALGMDGLIGSLEEGKKADVVLVKNEHSPVMFPILHPYGHVAFQAQRGGRAHRARRRPRGQARGPARRHRPRRRRAGRSRRPSSSRSASSATTSGRAGCTPRSPRRRSSRIRTSTPSGTPGRRNGSDEHGSHRPRGGRRRTTPWRRSTRCSSATA